MQYNDIITKAATVVKSFSTRDGRGELQFHNLAFTALEVKATATIARHYPLSDEENFCITVASWFHGLGYWEDAKEPEEISAMRSSEFLKSYGATEKMVRTTKACILVK
ncbi:MAG: hypothetical protein EOO46_01130 [Flavobacterium sp.]|nr:MAG: hypothetical protein EOO46_01130 [Flavobacterium sp.]